MAPATPSTEAVPPLRVGFAAEVHSIRQPSDDETSVMSYLTKHASRCSICADPYTAYRQDIPLCDRGNALAKDVSHYIYPEGGKLYSVVDLHNLGERNQIQIPAGMEVINLLTKAFDRGFVVQRRQNRPIIEMKGEKVERPFYEQTRKEPTSPRNENTEERRYRQRDVEIVEITPSSRRERITDNISLANRAKYWRKEKPRSSISPERKCSLYYMDEEDRRRRRQYAQEPIVIVAEPRRRYIRDRSLPPLAEKVGKTKTSGTQPSEFTGGTRAEVATEAEFDKSKSWPDKMMPDKGLNPEEDNASEAVQMTFDQEVRSKWESMIIEELKAADRQTAGSKSQVGKRHSLLKGEQGPTGDSHLERARDQSKDDIPFSTREESAIEADRALQDATIGVRGRPKSKDSTRKPSQPQSPELELGDTFNDCSWKGLDGEYAGDLEGPEQRENSGVEDMRESQSVVVNEATNDIVPQSDSGYASGGVVCTVETTQTQMQAWSGVGPSSFEDNEPKKEESVEQQDLTEIASVLSDYDEIGSRTEIRKSPEHLAAEDQIRAFFAQHSNIEALCRELLPQMGRERFVRNFRRLLKSYYKAQVKLARSNIEHSTVFLLRSKFQRERIALSVADRLDPKEEIRFDAEKDLQEIGDRTSRVQEWLKIQKAFALDDEPAETDANSPTLELSDDDEAEEIIANEHYQFPHIDRMKDFLGSSSPFRGLIIDLHLLLIPCQFQSLARTLLAIPSDSIDMTGEYRPTVVNSIKSAVDGVTKTQWNWWPLNQSIKPPINGYRRITWKCHCRRKLWQDIPKEYIDQFRRLIPLRGSQTIGTHICAQLFARPNKQQLAGRNGTMLARLPFRTVPSPHSSPHNQTPTQAAAVATQSSPSQRSSSSSSSRPSSRMSGTSSMGQAPSSATSIASLSASINIPGTEDFVLLGINGTRRTLDLVHIKTTKENDDDLKFFDTLLKSYKSLRGTMRRWFSVWHLNHCDFVKFKKIMPDRVVLAGIDLPNCPIDYSYDPRPPNPLAPAIDRHMWELALLRPCMRPFSCMGLPRFCLLSYFHDCVPDFRAGSSIFLPRIPQKHSRWLIETPEMDYAWGVVAKEEPYMAILVVYHLVMFAGPFGFWAWWLAFQHAQTGVWDLQNAAVPATVVGVLVSLFWSAAQPLRVLDAR